MKNNNRKQVAKISIFITSIFVIFLSVSYSFINLTLTGTKKQVITVGNLDLELEEDENNLTITNALPMYDEVGMIQEPFTFRLVNKTATDTNYIIKLVPINTNNLSQNDVKYGLEKDGVKRIGLVSSIVNGIVDSGTIKGNQTINYTLRLWIKDDVTSNTNIQGKSLNYKIGAELKQKIECPVLVETEPNKPELATGMIPVTYDEANKTWVKADTSSEWYNYGEQIWANAVTVTETNRTTYMSANPGTPISMDDINTMWVWIPRYSYTIRDTYGVRLEGGDYPSSKTPGAIDIKFITADQKDSGTAKCSTCPDNWTTPVGFTFGEEELPGFWVGKFETTGKITTACTDENCATMNLTIKPNEVSLMQQKLSSFFYASRSMLNISNANKYGFESESSTLDTHMLKNSEWGIVAMLSQSKYGKYGNPNYIGVNKEIYQNKSKSYITGMSNGTISTITNTQVTYDTPDTGYGASTTGTIYGIYDMSGGSNEYVMGNYNNDSGQNATWNSGFCGIDGPVSGCVEWPNTKYYDLYTTINMVTGYKQGDATYETNGWYDDRGNYFVDSSFSFFERGGNYSNFDSGVFRFNRCYGAAYNGSALRLALKP